MNVRAKSRRITAVKIAKNNLERYKTSGNTTLAAKAELEIKTLEGRIAGIRFPLKKAVETTESNNVKKGEREYVVEISKISFAYFKNSERRKGKKKKKEKRVKNKTLVTTISFRPGVMEQLKCGHGGYSPKTHSFVLKEKPLKQ